MSVTTLACPACGRLDYPHACKPLLESSLNPWEASPTESVTAELEQGRVKFDIRWTFATEDRGEGRG